MSLGLTKIDNFVVLAEAWGIPARPWNPLTGCTGEGCAVGPKNCWAARRQKSFNPTYWPERAEKILHVRDSSIIVCNYMGEIFSVEYGGYRLRQEGPGKVIGNEVALARIINYQYHNPQHIYFWLTKHPERYADFDWPDGTWLGTTVNQRKDLDRICKLSLLKKDIKRYVYFEPLLGEWISYKDMLASPPIIGGSLKYIDWVIIGGKSRGTLPGIEIHKESVAAVVATCELLGIPVFCKDNLKPVFKDEFDSLPREVPKKPKELPE